MEKLQQWQRVKEIVGSALERPPEERSAFLDQVSSENAEMRAEVDSLLAAYQDSDGLSAVPWSVASPKSETQPPGHWSLPPIERTGRRWRRQSD